MRALKTCSRCFQGTKKPSALRSKPPNLVPKVLKMLLPSVQNHQILSPRYQKTLCPPFKTIKSCPGTRNSVFHSRISIKNGPANKKHYKNAGAKTNTKKTTFSFEDFSQNRQVARYWRLDFSLPARNGPGPPAKTSKRTIRNHSPPRRQAGR